MYKLTVSRVCIIGHQIANCFYGPYLICKCICTFARINSSLSHILVSSEQLSAAKKKKKKKKKKRGGGGEPGIQMTGALHTGDKL